MQRGIPPLSFRRVRTLPGQARAFSVALFAAAAMAACQRSEPPELLSVHRLEPARAAAGDRLTVTGEGFPEGRPATVLFRGDLYRPGAPPERDVQIVAQGTQSARNALTVPLDGVLERRFVGRGSAAHTTFRGQVRVTFEPSAAGLAGIGGSAENVRFDVLPTRTEATDAADAESATPASSGFLGLSASPEPESSGLRITAVVPDGRAAAAGLRPGDVLVDFDGVTALSEGDLRARGGQQTAELVVERDGRALPPLTIDVEGLAPLGPAALVRVGGVLVALSVLLMLLATRLSDVLRWVPRAADLDPVRNLARHGAAEGPGRGRGFARTVDALTRPLAEGPALSVAGFLTLGTVLVSVARIGMGLGQHAVFSSDLDLAVATLSASAALLCTRFADGGFRPGDTWSFGAGLSSLAATLGCVGPAIIAVAGAVLASGRFVIAEMVADQGATPWRWAAARNPGLAALAVLLLASTALESGHSGPLSASGLRPATGVRSPVSRVLVRLAEWIYLWVMAALSVVLFFGGWRLPGVTLAVQESSRALSLVGASLLIAKILLVVLAVGAARGALSRIFVEQVARPWAKFALPAALAFSFLAAAFGTALEGPHAAALGDLCGVAMPMLAGLIVSYLVLAATRVRASEASPAGVNPWL